MQNIWSQYKEFEREGRWDDLKHVKIHKLRNYYVNLWCYIFKWNRHTICQMGSEMILNSMVRGLFWEVIGHSASRKISWFNKYEAPLPCSQKPAAKFYHDIFIRDTFNVMRRDNDWPRAGRPGFDSRQPRSDRLCDPPNFQFSELQEFSSWGNDIEAWSWPLSSI
jgi:hypothetical protein